MASQCVNNSICKALYESELKKKTLVFCTFGELCDFYHQWMIVKMFVLVINLSFVALTWHK